MSFKPIQKLNVSRTFSTGSRITVGTLAQNKQGVFFQYDADYLKMHSIQQRTMMLIWPRWG
jgi:serine/threonine-protein kinase HipA